MIKNSEMLRKCTSHKIESSSELRSWVCKVSTLDILAIHSYQNIQLLVEGRVWDRGLISKEENSR